MTDAVKLRTGRRRRIVGMIALSTLALSWWFWPRGDQRFVGKWWFVNETTRLRFVLDLHSNERGNRHGVAPHDLPFEWTVRGDEFLVGSSRFSALPGVVQQLISRLRTLLGFRKPVNYEAFEVLELNPELIRMVSKQNGNRYLLTPYRR